jgi:hypothetical protein
MSKPRSIFEAISPGILGEALAPVDYEFLEGIEFADVVHLLLTFPDRFQMPVGYRNMVRLGRVADHLHRDLVEVWEPNAFSRTPDPNSQGKRVIEVAPIGVFTGNAVPPFRLPWRYIKF